jgi:predicted dehydrogenase
MIRLATIGTNIITRWFLDAARKCPELKYVAVYSRTKETASAFAKEYGIEKYYTDLEVMARAKDIDAVYIASPNSFHCEQAILMLKNKKHVLCEKTIASNSEELSQMLKAAEENGVVLLEAVKSVFDPGFDALVENLDKAGCIRRVSFQYCQYSSRYDKFKEGIVENAFNPAFSNGALMDIGVYCIHPLVKLFGMPEKVYGDSLFLSNGIDGSGTILAGYQGMQAELLYSKISNSRIPSQIQGENASLVIRDIQDIKEISIFYNNGSKEEILVEKDSTIMLYEIKEWIRLIENNLTAKEHNSCSVMELEIMDKVRRQLGIVFPADRKRS